jgi:hypothetical protein
MSQTAQEVGNLTRTGKCSVGNFGFIASQSTNTAMELNNDGGWCWTNAYYQSGRTLMTAYYVSVLKDNPPKHGHILIGDVPNGRVRIAYQPDAGFIGTDSFTIHFGVVGANVTFSVTTSQ